MRSASRVVLCLAVCALLGCGGRQTGGTPGVPVNSNVITRIEVSETNAQNAYQVVQRLRPNWLRQPSQSFNNPTAGAVVIYLDGTRMGGLDFLYQISATDIETMQHLNAAEASSRYGLNHTGGAILVVTRR